MRVCLDVAWCYVDVALGVLLSLCERKDRPLARAYERGAELLKWKDLVRALRGVGVDIGEVVGCDVGEGAGVADLGNSYGIKVVP